MAKKEIQLMECPTCGKSFIPSPYQRRALKIGASKQAFCTVDCSCKRAQVIKYMQIRTCLCGNTFEVTQASPQKTCSTRCGVRYRQFMFTKEGIEAFSKLPLPIPVKRIVKRI